MLITFLIAVLPLFLYAFYVFEIVGIYYIMQPIIYQNYIDIYILSTFQNNFHRKHFIT